MSQEGLKRLRQFWSNFKNLFRKRGQTRGQNLNGESKRSSVIWALTKRDGIKLLNHRGYQTRRFNWFIQVESLLLALLPTDASYFHFRSKSLDLFSLIFTLSSLWKGERRAPLYFVLSQVPLTFHTTLWRKRSASRLSKRSLGDL